MRVTNNFELEEDSQHLTFGGKGFQYLKSLVDKI